MNCCITDLRNKEVISAKNGCRLGFVSDVEIDTCSGCLTAIIIWGKSRCFGLMGRDEDIKICWKDIEVIGDETILVNFKGRTNCGSAPKKGPQILGGLFR
jgi:YlmC/YmxH family sporulation protein